MNTIYIVVWGAEKQDLKLLDGIKKYIKNEIKQKKKLDFNVEIEDIKSIGETTYKDLAVVFGKQPQIQCVFNGPRYFLPDIKSMRIETKDCLANKRKVFVQLNNIIATIDTILTDQKKTEEKQDVYVESEGVKIGNTNVCDIKITPAEAKHLKSIKDILGGGTIVIQKGDVRLEIK